MSEDFAIGDLRAFVATVRSGSFSRAATTLGTSQPAVSQRVQRLERIAAGALLVRGPRGVRLTPRGESLLGFAERMLALHEQARRNPATITGSSGRRTIGLLEDLAVTSLPVILADFARLHPEVDLEVLTGPAALLARTARRGQLDLAFGDPDVMPEAALRWRSQIRLAWCAAPGIDLAADSLPLVLFSGPCRWRQPLLDALERGGRRWRVAFQSTSMPAVQAAVRAGLGISALLPPNVRPGTEVPARRLPPAPLVDIAVSRRPGREGDPATDSLERLLIASVEGVRG